MDRTHPRSGRAPRRAALAAGLLLAGLPACDFLDPTRVENPQTTTEDLARAQNPTAALLPGLRAQFARALGAMVVTSETVSDNYSIESTGLSKEVDDPYIIIPSVGMINSTGGTGLYWNTQELRALADFVLNEIAPADQTATTQDVAEAHFYRGMAFLMQGENFVGLPVAAGTEPVAADELLQRAVADLDAALQQAPNGPLALAARAALARAQRMRGDAAAARTAAQAALAADPDFVFAQGYDASYLANTPYFFLVSRATAEMQPLPRLDFLDPKYTSFEAPVPYAKAEEMHLILAEADLAAGNVAGAASHLADAVALAESRATEDFFDPDERKNSNLTIRPRDSEIVVRADATSPFRADLVLGQGTEEGKRGDVTNRPISGTSLDADSVRGLSSAAQVAHALWLARQEILFLEGRRMSDLGIRLPIAQREIDASPVIDDAHPFTDIVVPSWIPRNGEMDLFTPLSPYVDPRVGSELATREVTILVDMNQRLAQNLNEASPFLRQ